jgi:DNA-binding transcriptional LysR family regulator
MLAGAEAAQAVIDRVRSEPQGLIKLACPPGLSSYLIGGLLADFMDACPQIQLQLKALNRRVDVIAEVTILRSGRGRLCEIKADSSCASSATFPQPSSAAQA